MKVEENLWSRVKPTRHNSLRHFKFKAATLSGPSFVHFGHRKDHFHVDCMLWTKQRLKLRSKTSTLSKPYLVTSKLKISWNVSNRGKKSEDQLSRLSWKIFWGYGPYGPLEDRKSPQIRLDEAYLLTITNYRLTYCQKPPGSQFFRLRTLKSPNQQS